MADCIRGVGSAAIRCSTLLRNSGCTRTPLTLAGLAYAWHTYPSRCYSIGHPSYGRPEIRLFFSACVPVLCQDVPTLWAFIGPHARNDYKRGNRYKLLTCNGLYLEARTGIEPVYEVLQTSA